MGTSHMDGRAGTVLPEVPTRAHIRDGVMGDFTRGRVKPGRSLSVAFLGERTGEGKIGVQVGVRFGVLLLCNRRIILVGSRARRTRDTRCPGDHGVDESTDDDG